MVAAKYNENYCEETLKALTIILYTNYIVSPDSYDLSDIDICLPESKAENSVKEITIKSNPPYLPYIKRRSAQTAKRFIYLFAILPTAKLQRTANIRTLPLLPPLGTAMQMPMTGNITV